VKTSSRLGDPLRVSLQADIQEVRTKTHKKFISFVRSRRSVLRQFVRFSIVGVFNTAIDLVAFNIFFLCFPTRDVGLLVVYNSTAYALGALNSYILNKYWTFQQTQATTGREFMRFAIVNLCGILCNNFVLWVVAGIAHPFVVNPALWANISKITAITGTMTISYLGMRLWVFVGTSQARTRKGNLANEESEPMYSDNNRFLTNRSLSVILPAHNEDEVIAQTVHAVLATLTPWVPDFEVIVVNDGSRDSTQTIVEAIAATDFRVRLITHPINQGYGAALVTGFAAVTKELAFFMDADGQFDTRDLKPFFPLIDTYDAVLGYRIDRQDTWMRKLNACGWKLLVSAILKVHVRDVDCAFKLYRTEFLHRHSLETRGAMINAEMLYKLKRFGYTYTQLGVHHLPRKSGRATGAKLTVIVRALRELYTYGQKWHREEQQQENLYTLEIQ